MGHTVAKIKIYNPRDKSRCLDLELLTDTGSTYTWIRHDKLEKLGIKPTEKVRFRTIDNRVVERNIGEAVVECMSRKATTIAVFAEESDNEVLGLHALEGLRLEVDPITKQLKEVEAVLAL
jgi:predicted aspartyl protease